MSKPSLAIAYSMKKKKKASGGTVESGDKTMDYSEGGKVGRKNHTGDQSGVHTSPVGDGESTAAFALRRAKGMHEKNPKKKENESFAKDKHTRVLNELKSMKGPTSGKSGFAEGGQVSCPNCSHMFSHGGEVENSDKPIADGMPNEFDVLHLEDTLEFKETGENSGDEDGDHRSHKEDDLVSRAMLKRKAKR